MNPYFEKVRDYYHLFNSVMKMDRDVHRGMSFYSFVAWRSYQRSHSNGRLKRFMK